MSDHIEAMAREWVDGAGSLPLDTHHPDIQRAIRKRMSDVWAAGIEAVIAHEPCGGTGHTTDLAASEREFLEGLREVRCDGPHTVIVKGDGTKLYADVGRVQYRLLPPDETGEIHGVPINVLVPWPSEWRIE